MKDFVKGGRGKVAPYKTQHYRIPLPIKPVVELLANAYRQTLGSLNDPKGDHLIEKVKIALSISTDELNKPVTKLLEDDLSEDDEEDFEEDFEETETEEERKHYDKLADERRKNSIRDLRLDISVLEREAVGYQETIKVLEQELVEVRLQLEKTRAYERDAINQLTACHTDAFKAADILKPGLKLPSNAGGGIKKLIKEALLLIDDV